VRLRLLSPDAEDVPQKSLIATHPPQAGLDCRPYAGRLARGPKSCALLRVYLPDSSLWLLVVSGTISGLSVVVLEYSGDPGEPDRQSSTFSLGQSAE
jgi:hypothetical protein